MLSLLQLAPVTFRPTLPYSKNITISGSLKHDILGAFRGFASLNPHQSFAMDSLVGSHGPRPPAVFGLLWLHHCQVASDAPVMGKQINFTCTYSLTWPPQSISSCENVCISQPISFKGICWELAPSIQTTSVVSLLCQTGISKTLKPILISTL